MQDLNFVNELRNIPGEYPTIKPSKKGAEEIKKEAEKLMKKDKTLTIEQAIEKAGKKKLKELSQKFLNKIKRKKRDEIKIIQGKKVKKKDDDIDIREDILEKEEQEQK